MITKRDMHFIDIAKRHAASSEKVSGARIGAVLVIKNRIVSFGTNQYKTHPFQAEYGRNDEAIFLHAEIDAIKNALRFVDVEDLRRSILYIVRVKNENSDPKSKLVYGLAKPCIGCKRAIANFGIRRVIYSTDIQNFEILLRAQ